MDSTTEHNTAAPVDWTEEQSPLAATDVLQTVPCAACGAPLDVFDRFCPSCGRRNADERTAVQPRPQAAAETQAEVETEAAAAYLRCTACGAQIAVERDVRSLVCPFCDSPHVRSFDPDRTGRQEPEFVIGFAVTAEQAREAFRRWLASNSWFRPGDLSTARIEGKLQGVYLPFWSFAMLAESRWSARIGEYWYKTETYTTRDAKGRTVVRTRRRRMTEWWPLSGRHHRYYSGFLISGSRGLPQEVAERIKPYRLELLQRYAPRFLAGWLCEEYSVERAEALARCKQEFLQQELRNVAAFLPGDTYGQLQVSTGFSHESSDLILLPVHLLSYRYGKKLYRFLVNGQTGKAWGEKPVSVAKVVSVVLLALALLGGLLFALAALEGLS